MSRFAPHLLILALAAGLTVHAAPSPKLELVIAAQRERVAERPDDAVVHNDLGNLLVAARRLEQAEAAYDRAVALAPTAPAVRFNRALLLHDLGRQEEAEADYLEVLAWEPRHAWAHYQLGRLAAERGQRERAVTYYAKAFALDTELALAKVNPHVIDNPLLTEALLEARLYIDGGSSGAEVPRQYGDGIRIVQSLLDETDEVEEEDAEEAPEAEGELTDEEAKQLEMERSSRERGQAEAGAGGQSASRVLDSSSLEKGSTVGQAKPTGAAPYTRPGTLPQRSPVRVRTGGHQNLRPSPSPPVRNTPPRTGRAEAPPTSRVRGVVPNPGVVRRPDPNTGGVNGAVPRYRPSRRSTSSLRLELLPAAGSPAADPARG